MPPKPLVPAANAVPAQNQDQDLRRVLRQIARLTRTIAQQQAQANAAQAQGQQQQQAQQQISARKAHIASLAGIPSFPSDAAFALSNAEVLLTPQLWLELARARNLQLLQLEDADGVPQSFLVAFERAILGFIEHRTGSAADSWQTTQASKIAKSFLLLVRTLIRYGYQNYDVTYSTFCHEVREELLSARSTHLIWDCLNKSVSKEAAKAFSDSLKTNSNDYPSYVSFAVLAGSVGWLGRSVPTGPVGRTQSATGSVGR